MSATITPYGQTNVSKKAQVAQMFDSISGSYDFLNHFLSMGIDILWRRKAVSLLRSYNPKIVADIATGTGDFAIEALKLNPTKVIGVDISEGMLKIGREKIQKRGLSAKIEMRLGDSEELPFETDSIDAITVGFGVRNFENLEKGLGEILRVIRPGGAVVILEPAVPTKFPLKQLFNLYFTKILPLLGRFISKDRAAYDYLPNSVMAFPNGENFLEICRRVGFKNVQWKPLTFGICSLYLLEK